MDRTGIFAGDDPFVIARAWLDEATKSEINDPNAMALATVDQDGLPNVRMVLLKEISADAFWFYTNYQSAKGRELEHSGRAALVLHWKSLRRQIRVPRQCHAEDGPAADAYFASRSLKSRLGAWASQQSQPLESRGALMAEVAKSHRAQRHESAAAAFLGWLSASSRWRSSSGPMVLFACTTGLSGAGKVLKTNGKFKRLNPMTFTFREMHGPEYRWIFCLQLCAVVSQNFK